MLVDDRDNFIGPVTKRECHRVGPDGEVPLHRAFSVLLFNSAGELLVQKRASQKVNIYIRDNNGQKVEELYVLHKHLCV